MPSKLDFYKPDVFANTNNRLVRMALRIDDKLVNSDEYLSVYDILGIDRNKESLTGNRDYEDFRKVISELKKFLGSNLEILNKEGKLKAYRYAYAQYGDNDFKSRAPFAEIRKITKTLSFEEYSKKMKNLMDFIPDKMLQDIFQDTGMLIEIERDRKNKNVFISPESNILLSGVDYLPEIYSAIAKKKILWLKYKGRYREGYELLLHPHYLKEYNGRWYACGIKEIEKEGKVKKYRDCLIALDRIEDIDELEENSDIVEIKHYEKLFQDIVGVTHEKGSALEEVKIRCNSEYVFNLLKTKKLHSSQYEDVSSGEMIVYLMVKPNNELITKILSYGSGIEVVSPENLRIKIADIITKLKDIYLKS